MLETYFSASKMLGHLRSGPSGRYLDDFAAVLERQGYSPATAVRYLRAAAHLGHVMAERGAGSDDIDRLDDIEWEMGSLRVSGKSRYEVRLPLPQDVGDAIAAYLECRPSTGPGNHVFLRTIAPCRPFRNGDGISSVVKRLMQRAGMVTPFKGAHVLRHTAATEMLRHGVPLEKIGLVLRHRGIDTTAHYAKADVTLLKQIAQPWPEVL
jgi:integrase